MKNIAKLTSYGCYLDCDFVTAKYPEDEIHIVGNVAEYVYDLEQKISDLEAKLAEYKLYLESFKDAQDRDSKYIFHLEGELAEKSRLLKTNEMFLRGTKFIKEEINQDKISFALEQLEKVKEFVNTYNKEHCFLSTEIDTCNKSVEIIDNQIEQLKEGK